MLEGRQHIHAPAPEVGLAGGGIVEVLRASHAQLTAMFDRYVAVSRNASLSAVRDRLVRCICDTLSAQLLAEEEVLYPEIRKENDKLVFAFLLANEGISMRIAKIRDPAAPKLARDLGVLRLIGMVRRYMVERELALFPFLRCRLSATHMQWLGASFAQRTLLHAAGNVTELPRAPDATDDGAAISAAAANSPLAWGVRAAGVAAGV